MTLPKDHLYRYLLPKDESMHTLLVRNGQPDWLVQSTADISRHEGFREFAYPDPLSVLGKRYAARKYQWGFVPGDVLLAKYGEREADGRPWTVGYGFTKGVTPRTRMSKEFADNKLSGVILEHTPILDRLVPTWKAMPLFASTTLVNLAFNLGTNLKQFGPTLSLFTKADYSGAANHLRKSLWYRQVGDRGRELTARLDNREIEAQHKVV